MSPGLDPLRDATMPGTYRVLLVEDNPAEAELVLDRLSGAKPGDFSLTHVVSMQEACDRCRSTRFDCVVLDLQLPDTGGVETIRTMKENAGDAAIVAYSGLDDERARAASLKEGAQDFISKNGPEAGSLDRSILFALERRRAMKLYLQFEELFYAHPDAMFVLDDAGDIVVANRTAETLLTSESARLVEQCAVLQIGGRREIEMEVEGQLHAGELRVVACDWGHAPARLVVIRDVTELKRLSGRYRKLKRMQDIGRFAGGLAHDFGHILSCIDLLSAVAQRQIVKGVSVEEHLGDIRAAAASGRIVVDQLLSLEKSQRPAPELADPRQIVERVEHLVRPVLPDNIDLSVTCVESAPSIYIDEGNLERALFNLAFNAREAMPEGGRISMSCSVEADLVVFRVSDTGRGVAPEHIPQVFDLFHSTKPRVGGHGLGLAICQAITDQAGGSIWVENLPGAGAQFTIALPLRRAQVS